MTSKETDLYRQRILADLCAGRGARGQWKYVRDGEVRRLFDLSLDQHEQADFSYKHPEILQRLMKEFDEWNGQMLPRPPARR